MRNGNEKEDFTWRFVLLRFWRKRRIDSIWSRPVLVVQANEFNTNAPTIIVVSLTTVLKKRYLPSHIILGKEFGLKKPSMVLLEQIQTITIGFAQKQLRLEYHLKKMNK